MSDFGYIVTSKTVNLITTHMNQTLKIEFPETWFNIKILREHFAKIYDRKNSLLVRFFPKKVL